MASSPRPRRVIAASFVGTSLEWYDFFLYGTAAALVFNKLFFPTFDPLTGTMLAFATYAVGFVARPLGGIVFGHFGDRAGRKTVLVVTLLMMGVSTFLIGLLPELRRRRACGAGPAGRAPVRPGPRAGRRVGRGGAHVAGARRRRRRGFNASWPQVGVPAGNLLAAGVLAMLVRLLSEAAFLSWGWRVPFLLSGVLVLVGLWVRLKIAESRCSPRWSRPARRRGCRWSRSCARTRAPCSSAIGARIGDGRRLLHLHRVHPSLRHRTSG